MRPLPSNRETTPFRPNEERQRRLLGVGRKPSSVRMPEGIRIVISLGRPLPVASSSLPAARPEGRGRCGSHLAAYLALLRLGVTVPSLLPATRWALTPPFHPYHRSLNPSGGLFSVARSVASRRPGVTWQSTQWSSDFPRDGKPASRPSRRPLLESNRVSGLRVFPRRRRDVAELVARPAKVRRRRSPIGGFGIICP